CSDAQVNESEAEVFCAKIIRTL
ncbi:hypothetical protein L195_g039782, partial [Trifolium pratense]